MSEKMREEFAQAYHEKYGRLPQNWSESAGKYFDAHGNGAWWAWQASRAALCVELPGKVQADEEIGEEYDEYAMGANCMRLHCEKAIHAAGVKTK